jgi:hypothetical protein
MINAIQVLRYHLLELEKVSRVHSLLIAYQENNMQKNGSGAILILRFNLEIKSEKKQKNKRKINEFPLPCCLPLPHPLSEKCKGKG